MTEQLVATYSIVARDAETGQLGVAVQSCYVAVGAAVIWGEAGVGVVATQSFANIDFGPEGLAMMRDGVAPADALRRLLDEDPRRETRQVALLRRVERPAISRRVWLPRSQPRRQAAATFAAASRLPCSSSPARARKNHGKAGCSICAWTIIQTPSPKLRGCCA